MNASVRLCDTTHHYSIRYRAARSGGHKCIWHTRAHRAHTNRQRNYTHTHTHPPPTHTPAPNNTHRIDTHTRDVRNLFTSLQSHTRLVRCNVGLCSSTGYTCAYDCTYKGTHTHTLTHTHPHPHTHTRSHGYLE